MGQASAALNHAPKHSALSGDSRSLTKHQGSCIMFQRVTGEELLDAVQQEQSASKRPRLYAEWEVDNLTAFMPRATEADATQTGQPGADSEQVSMMITTPMDESEASGVEAQLLGRGMRRKWKTKRYHDPKRKTFTILQEHDVSSASMNSVAERVALDEKIRVGPNANGVFREYISRPTYIPDESSFDSSCQNYDRAVFNGTSEELGAPIEPAPGFNRHETAQRPWFSPFLNVSTFRLMKWFWLGSQNKSVTDLQSLAETVLKAQDFKASDLVNFNARAENRRLDKWADELTSSESQTAASSDNWIEADVSIALPTRTRLSSESEAPPFTVSGLLYRPIVEVLRRIFQSKEAFGFHYTPFKQFWQREGTDAPERVYDDLYSGDAWLQAHRDVQRIPRDDGNEYERVVAGLMLWSDSTHLANFGNASLWPLYLFVGNQPKHEQSKPGSHACHHIAYFPTLPDNISDVYKQLTGGKRPTVETLTHCKRDLMHAVLGIVFGEDFMKASRDGLVIQCVDGITRRIFPRILTYSADYPEKVLLSSIRFLSTYPCPRCLIKKSEAHKLGSIRNEAVVRSQTRQDSYHRQETIRYSRNLIYKDGRGVKCTAIEAVLASKSLVPTVNTFSRIMWASGDNFYRIFVVDLLHEIELGIWKALVVHLIRVLAACSEDAIVLLNERYRLTSTFGRDTIRRFTTDASSLKKLAARDYEDLLLCSIPAFEGLFPDQHDGIVQDLLFSLLTWHALAKLHTHTDRTLTMLDNAKRSLGAMLQRFQDTTCQAYETRELPAERARRERREARRNASKVAGAQSPEDQLSGSQDKAPRSRQDVRESKRKRFNLNTYKAHALEHYVDDIKQFGTVDSYSTQRGEFEHRTVKAYYSRTNKHNPTRQITRLERREQLLRQMSSNEPDTNELNTQDSSGTSLTLDEPGDDHHIISSSRNTSVYMPSWLREHLYDSATKDFRRKLKDHVLERLLKASYDDDTAEYTDADRKFVQIEYDRIYIHKLMRINYTNYEGRRKQDAVNPRTHADVMVLATNSLKHQHPYSYARVISIFHAVIRHTGLRSTTEGVPIKMHCLWVRWFSRAETLSNGVPSRHLHALTFVTDSDANAFGFLDPGDVVRGVHLIPAFNQGKTRDLLQAGSIGRQPADGNEDWKNYYINSFVDRDMFLRYNGGGVGHKLKLDGHSMEVPEPQFNAAIGFDTVDDEDSRRHVVVDLENDEVNSLDEDRDELEQEEESDDEIESEGDVGED